MEMPQLEWWDKAGLGCGTGQGKHPMLLRMQFLSEREGAMDFCGTTGNPTKWAWGPAGCLAETKLSAHGHHHPWCCGHRRSRTALIASPGKP